MTSNTVRVAAGQEVGRSVDLNADLGEGVGDDEAMLAIVTSARSTMSYWQTWLRP